MEPIVLILIGGLVIIVILAVARAVAEEQKPKIAPTTHPVGGYDENQVGHYNEYPGAFAWDIVGESNCQAALEELCGGKSRIGHDKQVWALVVPEHGNPHDSNAVAVHVDTGLVGYLNRENALRYRIAMTNLGLGAYALKVPARIVGGRSIREGRFGIKLDLPGEPIGDSNRASRRLSS